MDGKNFSLMIAIGRKVKQRLAVVIWNVFTQNRTCNRVSGSSKDPKLTAAGKRYIRLIFMGPES